MKKYPKLLFVQPDKSFITTYVTFTIKTQTMTEPEHLRGISHFTEHMTHKYLNPYKEKLKKLCCMNNAETESNTTCFYSTMLNENFHELFILLCKMIKNNSFSQESFDIEKDIILQEINQSEYNVIMDEVIASYLGHPLSNTLGTEETVKNITLQDIILYKKKFYNRRNLIVYINSCDPSYEIEARKLMDQYL